MKWGPTVQNSTKILHIPDILVCRSFRGANYFEHLSPETPVRLRVKRQQEYHEYEGRGRLWGQFSTIVHAEMTNTRRVSSSGENV